MKNLSRDHADRIIFLWITFQIALAAFSPAAAQTPTIDSVFPNAGPPSTVVTISGAHLGDFTSIQGNQVLFNGVPGILLSASEWTSTQIKVIVPLSATSGPVEILSNGSTSGPGPAFTVATPEVTGLSVDHGPVSSLLKVLGENFGNGVDTGSGRLAGAGRDLRVFFGGAPGLVTGQFCCNLSGWTDHEITVTVPRSAATAPVQVQIRAYDIDLDTGARSPGFVTATGPTFTVVTPEVTGLSVDHGPASSLLRVLGQSFGNGVDTGSGRLAGAGKDLRVFFGGAPGLVTGQFCCNLSGWTDHEITVTVPLSAATAPVQVQIRAYDVDLDTGSRSPGFVTAAGPTFTVVTPEVTGLSVDHGPASSLIRVLGQNFGNGVDTGSGRLAGAGKDLRVFFGGAPGLVTGQFCCNLSGWTDNQITVTVPLSAATAPVQVQIRAYDVDLDTGSRSPGFVTAAGPTFTVVTPEVTGLSLDHGPVSSLIQVLGQNFGNGVDTGSGRLAGAGADLHVLFDGAPGLIPGQFCCNLSGWTDNQITVTVPLSAATAPIQVQIRAYDVDLDTGARAPGFVTADGPVFSVMDPTLLRVLPSSAPVSAHLTVEGTDLGLDSWHQNRLRVRDTDAPILSWADEAVATAVPSGLTAGEALIHVQIWGRDLTDDGNGCCATGFVSSNTLSFEIGNTPPVADAGPDESVRVGDIVTLDGSGSSDVNQDTLTFFWSMVSRPLDSQATLSDPNNINPQFQVDRPGEYIVELVVDDGAEESEPDSIVISTINSPPVALAGPDQTATLGETIELNGGSSFDPDGDPIDYLWELRVKPTGSLAELSDPSDVSPTLTVDTLGDYEIDLTVSDGILTSEPDTVVVSTINSRPVADAGPDQVVRVHELALLSGSGSVDPDGQELQYTWSLLSVPAGSLSQLSDPMSEESSLLPDVSGTYVVQLIVSDGIADSPPDTASITAYSADSAIEALSVAFNAIASYPVEAFANRNSPRALLNKLEAVIRQIDNGNLESARAQLSSDLTPKLDGCVLRGVADQGGQQVRDWILECSLQEVVITSIEESIRILDFLIPDQPGDEKSPP